MLNKFAVVLILLLLVCQRVPADTIYLLTGQTIKGELKQAFPDTEKLVIKTDYGEQVFDRSQILTSIRHPDDIVVEEYLAAGKKFLNCDRPRKADRMFRVVLDIDEKFAPLIDKYKADYFKNTAQSKTEVIKKLSAPLPPMIPLFEVPIRCISDLIWGNKDLKDVFRDVQTLWAGDKTRLRRFLIIGGGLLLVISLVLKSGATARLERSPAITLIGLFLLSIIVINTIARLQVWSLLGPGLKALFCVNTLLLLVTFIGLWRMQKWGVFLFVVLAAFSQVTLIFSGLWKANGLIIPLIILVLCLIYYPRMEWIIIRKKPAPADTDDYDFDGEDDEKEDETET